MAITTCRRNAKLSESYRAVNMAALGATIYVIVLPFLLPALRCLLPFLSFRCASQLVFGRPCPLCGVTRGLACLLRGDVSGAMAWNPLVIPAATLLVLELVYRGFMLQTKSPPRRLRRAAAADLVVHTGLAAVYLGYSAAFILGWTA